MQFVDTHCHLQSERFDEDREEVLARALEALDWFVIVGDDIESSRAAVALCRERVYATAGVHPYHAKDLDDARLQQLEELCAAHGVVALGEVGLDYYNEFSPRPEQHRAFHAQLEVAAKRKLPVIIHNREADEDVYPILKEHMPHLVDCVMHCFGSDAASAERYLELGCHVSFAGNVTFPKAESLREAAAVVPLDRLMLETDAPYLAPQARRGKRCEPAFTPLTAEVLAQVQKVTVEELAAATTATATAFYRVPAQPL